MTETLQRATPEQIIGRACRQMIEALEGRAEMLDVCGLGVEDLWAAIVSERDEMLNRYREDDCAAIRD